MTCLYCACEYLNNSDHVFPSGLGGEDIHTDCVCNTCNNNQSDLERHLIRNFLGMPRSFEGVKLEDNEIPAFKAPILLHYDEQTNIVYEFADHGLHGFFCRAQVIIKDGEFYVESGGEEKTAELVKLFQTWRKDNGCLILAAPKTKSGTTEFLQFQREGDVIESTVISEKRRITKEIRILVLTSDHELYSILEPRLFVDDDQRLAIRARSVSEATAFMVNFLTRMLQNKPLRSYGLERTVKNPTLSVGYSFDVVKTERALVKIILNCLVHYFPAAKKHPSLTQWIDYVNAGSSNVNLELTKPNGILRSPKDTHTLLISQVNEGVFANLSLFNDLLRYSLIFPGLSLMNYMQHNRIVVRYKERKNVLETHDVFLASFARQVGEA